MGRIIAPTGDLFGKSSPRVIRSRRPQPSRRNKTVDTLNALKAVSGGLKVFNQAANLGTLIGGALDRRASDRRRDAAREKLEQDRAKQQKQVDTAVSEAGQALESIPRLQEPDTSPGGAVDAGTQQFLQSIGLSGPTLGESLSGSLMPSQALVSEEDAAARLAGLRDRSGPSSVIADMSKMSPEEAYAASELNEARLRAQADRFEAAKRGATINRRNPLADAGVTAQDIELLRVIRDRRDRGVASPGEVQLFDETLLKLESLYGPGALSTGSDRIMGMARDDIGRLPSGEERRPRYGYLRNPFASDQSFLDSISKANEKRLRTLRDQVVVPSGRSTSQLDVTRLSMPPTMSQDVAVAVSPELTEPLTVRPTATDLSQLQDLGPLSDRALATYDPAQLIAASGFAESEQQLQSLLRAAEREATPTTFADLLSGKSVKALQGDIIKQFGKNRKKPLTEEQRLKNLKLRKEISDMSGIESRRASAEKSRAQAAKVRKQIEELDAKIKKDKEKASKNKDYRRIRRGLSKEQRAIEDQYSKYLDQYAKANSLKDPDAKKRRLDSLKSSVPLFVGDDGELVSPIVSESQFSRLLESAGLDRKRINKLVKARGYDSSNKRLSMMELPSAATTTVDQRVIAAEAAAAEAAAAEAQNKAATNAAKVRGRKALIKEKQGELAKTPPKNQRKIERLEKDISRLETEIVDLEAEAGVIEPIDLGF